MTHKIDPATGLKIMYVADAMYFQAPDGFILFDLEDKPADEVDDVTTPEILSDDNDFNFTGASFEFDDEVEPAAVEVKTPKPRKPKAPVLDADGNEIVKEKKPRKPRATKASAPLADEPMEILEAIAAIETVEAPTAPVEPEASLASTEVASAILTAVKEAKKPAGKSPDRPPAYNPKEVQGGNPAKKVPTGYAEYQQNKMFAYEDRDPNEETEGDAPTVVEMVQVIKRNLGEYGFMTVYNPAGSFSGLDIYENIDVAVDGLSQATPKVRYAKCEPNDQTIDKIHETLKIGKPKFGAKLYSSLVQMMLCGTNDKTNVFYKAVAGRSNDGAFAPCVTLNDGQNATRLAPTPQNTTVRLTDDQVSRLLGIFEEAEQKSLMLALGRVLVGENGSKTVDNTVIRHTFRNLSIIVGTDAGLGKSTLFNEFLIPVLRKLGYVVSGVPTGLHDKGWVEPSTADLAFADDLSPEDQKCWLKSGVIKSVVSNSETFIDAKYEAFRKVKTRSVLIACSNGFDVRDVIGADSGILSRLHALETVPASKVYRPLVGHDERTLTVWNRTASELKLSTEALAVGLLSRCAELFLDVTGYRWVGNCVIGYDKIADDTLMEYSEGLRDNYRLAMNMNHAKGLVSAVARYTLTCYINAQKDKGIYDREEALDWFKNVQFSPQLVINYLKFGSELTGRENNVLSGFPELFAKEINWTSTRRNIAGINSRFALENSSSDVMLDLSKRMESNSGFNFPHSVAFYVSLWNSANSSASYSIDTLTALPLNAKLVASMTRHSVKDALDY